MHRSGFKSVRKKLDNLPQKHPILFAHLIFQSILNKMCRIYQTFETKIWPPLSADTRIKGGILVLEKPLELFVKEKKSRKSLFVGNE